MAVAGARDAIKRCGRCFDAVPRCSDRPRVVIIAVVDIQLRLVQIIISGSVFTRTGTLPQEAAAGRRRAQARSTSGETALRAVPSVVNSS